MTRFALPALVGLLAATVAVSPVAADQHQKPDLVTVLAAAEPQTQLMALVLTMQAMQQGAKVRVLLCGPAGDLALNDAPAAATAAQKPMGASPQGVLKKLAEAGAPVDVCAIYLPNKGVGAEALLPGIGEARPDVMAGHLLAPNTRILSF